MNAGLDSARAKRAMLRAMIARRPFDIAPIRHSLVLLSVVMLTGCADNVGKQDAADRQIAIVQRAAAKQDAGDIDGAIDLYNEALLDHPRAARTHLDLAILLHDQKRDLPAAVYHYRRYVQLRPETEKADMVQSRLRQAMQTLGAKGFEAREEAADRLGELERENASLRLQAEKVQKQVAALQTELMSTKAQLERARASYAEAVSSPPATGAADAAPVARTYRVERRDTLSGIALKVYGDSREWVKIYEANRDKIPNRDRLRPGVVLNIP